MKQDYHKTQGGQVCVFMEYTSLRWLVKERNALPWKRHFREAVYFRTGAKDTQLSLIFSENSQFSLREDIDDVISFSNLLFICAQFANIFVKLSEAGECKNEEENFSMT